MKTIKYGIVGFGAQGGTYAEYLYNEKIKGSSLGGICDIDEKKLNMSKEKYPNIPTFNNYITMLESGKIDAIITTVPHYLHPVMGIEAIKRGVPVLVEKPAGVYTKQVKELLECAKSNKHVPFAIMFNQRTNPLYQEIKKILDNKELGELRRTNWIINNWWRSSNYYNQSSWRATWGAEGGGVLVNQAPHQLDLIQWLCGKPKKVFAKCKFGAFRNILVENDVTAIFDYENGATGVFITCTHDIIGTDRLEIDLDGGNIIVENSKKAIVKKLILSESETDKKFTMEWPSKCFAIEEVDNKYEERIIEFDSLWGNQHCLVIENFSEHILHGKPILAPGEDGINGVQLANSMLLSSWLGKDVDYDFDEDLFINELNKKIKEEGKYPIIENLRNY